MTNHILTSGNDELIVTGFRGNATVTNLGGVPLGTGNGTATGEVGMKVILVGGDFPDVVVGSITIDQSTPGTTNAVDVKTVGNVTVSRNKGASAAGTLRVSLADFGVGEYETVAASQTGQVLGATGASGDFLSGLLIIPATTSPGNVLLLDDVTSITVFAGGASSVSTLIPFFVPLSVFSASGAWSVTTGSNVSVIAVGNFT